MALGLRSDHCTSRPAAEPCSFSRTGPLSLSVKPQPCWDPMVCEAAGVRFPLKGVISAPACGHGPAMREPASAALPSRAAPPALAVGSSAAAEVAARVQQLVAEYTDFVWRSLRRLGVAAADCDDGCQRVWVVLAKKIALIEPEKTRSYVFSVVVRVASE